MIIYFKSYFILTQFFSDNIVWKINFIEDKKLYEIFKYLPFKPRLWLINEHIEKINFKDKKKLKKFLLIFCEN
jgi:hypothetical protein